MCSPVAVGILRRLQQVRGDCRRYLHRISLDRVAQPKQHSQQVEEATMAPIFLHSIIHLISSAPNPLTIVTVVRRPSYYVETSRMHDSAILSFSVV